MLTPQASCAPHDAELAGRHVCILTTAHPVDDVRVNSKMAASFLARGCRVSWVGPRIAYFAEQVGDDERIDYRLVAPNRGRLDRLLAGRRVKAMARTVEKVDWWYSPDPDAAEISVSLARERGGRVLFDVHELFHGSLLDRYLLGRRASVVREYVRRRIARTCRKSDLVIGVNRSVLEPYLDDWSSACVVRNCAPMWFSEDGIGSKTASLEVRVMHGKALLTNGTSVVLDALTTLSTEAPNLCVLMFAGMGKGTRNYANGLETRLEQLRLDGLIEIRDGVPHRHVPMILASCDVGMIAYGRGLGEDSLPNRMFEYMAAGLAVVAPNYAREICEIIDSERIGLTADFDDPHDVERALRWIAAHPEECRDMGRRARTAFLKRHNWEAEFDRLFAAMGELK